MSKIIVYVEQSGGTARRAGLETLGAAQKTGHEVVAVLSGEGAAEAAAGVAGAARAIVLTGGGAYSSDGLAKDITAIAQEEGAQAVLFAASINGKDLLPRVAAHLDAVPFTDCIEFRTEGDGYLAVRPWLAGKCLATVGSDAPVFCASLRPNVFAIAEGDAPAVSERPATTETLTRVVATEAKAAGKLDVKEAPIVVSGGRGLKEPENFALLEQLADAFAGDAAVGASRAVVDMGWRPHAEQVGQTGKTVSPQLYFAVGISGAIQHLAGMRTSKVIVAINKDADAAIFKVADYGLVGDALEVVPALTDAIKAVVAGR